MRTKFILLTFLLGVVLINGSFCVHNRADAVSYLSFGVKVGILPTGGIVHYALFLNNNFKNSSIRPVKLNELINIGTGKWPIPGTSVFYDYFAENGMYDLSFIDKEDTINLDYSVPFDSIWKIRFDAHPFVHDLGKGWSNGVIKPSLKQQSFIYNEFGCRCYDQDYFQDTSFFKVLKSVVDPEWIDYYRNL